MTTPELIGYLASLLIAVSLMMKNVRNLRFINMLGAATFALYGLLIGALPVFLLNALTAGINLYHLFQAKRTKANFSIIALPPTRMPYLDKFLDFYQNDIRATAPNFRREDFPTCRASFILRNLVPAGLFIYEPRTDYVADIKLDYVIPDYRDLQTAEFNFTEQALLLKDQGIKTFRLCASNTSHRRFLDRLGFLPDAADPLVFLRPVSS